MRQKQQSGGWFAIITRNVLAATELNDKQKLVFALVSNLQGATGECWASNEYLADVLNTSERTISRAISVLVEYGYIKQELDKSGKGTQRSLSVVTDAPYLSSHDTPKMAGADTPNLSSQYISQKKSSYNNKIEKTPEIAFNELWEAYGRKLKKQDAQRAFKRLKKSEWDNVLEHARKFRKNHEAAQKTDYMPYLSTYLNGKRYEETPEVYKSATAIGQKIDGRKDFE